MARLTAKTKPSRMSYTHNSAMLALEKNYETIVWGIIAVLAGFIGFLIFFQ